MRREGGIERGDQDASRLNTDLARENPEQYKALLFDTLSRETRHTATAWNLYKNRGVFQDDSLVLDTNTWISDTRVEPNNKKIIRLGTQSLSVDMRKRLIFEDSRFQGDGEMVYRLSHEIGHEVGFDAASNHDGMNKLFSLIAKLRGQGGGMSSLGNLDFYARAGANIQATEDLVELVNMYMIDPEYLERYLHFLSNPSYQSERDRLGLYSLTDTRIGSFMLKTIEGGVSSVLNPSAS